MNIERVSKLWKNLGMNAEDVLQYKAFLVTWKVLQQHSSLYYKQTKECIEKYRSGEMTEAQVKAIYPDGIKALIEEQKRMNWNMFVQAILATNDSEFDKVKKINPRKIERYEKNLPKSVFSDVLKRRI